ncbi:MAG TPA: DNA-binding protein [Porphyromonadaceae bacterium]|nr:DNA-binding protein [Porphyromonadaceae bacterium]
MSHAARNHAAANNPITPTPKVDRRGYSEEEAAYYLGLSRASLRQGRMEGRRENRLPPPPYVRLGRKILYLKDDLDRWLEENRHEMKGV